MAVIEKTGIYKDADGDYFQFKSGQDVPDEYAKGLTYSEAWPEPGQPLGAKATAAPDNKKANAPENKGA